jgi:hypothetical protein
MQALGRPQDMFSDKNTFQPIFAQWIQGLHTAAGTSLH